MIFAYCIDCKELHYGVADKNGVFDRSSGASNHWNHRNIVFHRRYDAYVAPVKNVLSKLEAKLPIRPIEMIFFKTAIDLAEDEDQDKFEQNLLR